MARQVKPKMFKHNETMILCGYDAERWRLVRRVTEARLVMVETEVM